MGCSFLLFLIFLMFLITRIGKPPDLLYCRFKSNQNIFLNKVKYTRILVSETGSLILITLLSAGLFHCFSFPIEMFGCVIYNFPLMRAPSCLSINIFLPMARPDRGGGKKAHKHPKLGSFYTGPHYCHTHSVLSHPF